MYLFTEPDPSEEQQKKHDGRKNHSSLVHKKLNFNFPFNIFLFSLNIATQNEITYLTTL
jgi:hypothetical protein